MMDEAETDRLCEQLYACIAMGPGDTPDAMKTARGIIQQFRYATPWAYLICVAGELESEFERWFSPRRWRGHDAGQSLKGQLYADISRLKSAMSTWRNKRGNVDDSRLDQ
jgi:hypothetical protein